LSPDARLRIVSSPRPIVDAQFDKQRLNVDFPTLMIESLDRETGKLDVTRQSIIKVWLAESLAAQRL
jgi:hypothetical protein